MQSDSPQILSPGEIADFARKQLGGDVLRESGSVFYSGHRSMKRGDFYLMGFNPGGDPKTHKGKIAPHLQYWEDHPDHNAYCDECWISRKGESVLQRRVQWLCAQLLDSKDAVREVCSANLIFVRSKEASKLKMPERAAVELCWPVHWHVLSRVVKPKVIITFGKKTYRHLQEKFSPHQKSEEEILDANHKTSRGSKQYCRRFLAELEFGDVWIFGLLHLSRWSPESRCLAIVDWIRTVTHEQTTGEV